MAIKRYGELDVFRGLAIIAVLLYHYTTRYNEIYGHDGMPFGFPYGRMGVNIFFMISGFVIYKSIENIKSWSDFLVNRFSRLYPAYWASIVIIFCFVSVFTLPGRQASIYDALINFSMLQDWISGVKQVDGAFWTLSRFVSFYFFVFLIYILKLKSKIVQVSFLWLLVICISKFAAENGIILPRKVTITLLLNEGSFFVVGIMFYLIKHYGHKLSFYLVISFCLISIYFVNGISLFLTAFVFSLILFLFTKGHLGFINIRPLIWLGGISYSLYLVHQNIGYIIINILKSADLNFALIVLIPTAISLFIATMITYYIEKPALIMLRRRFSSN